MFLLIPVVFHCNQPTIFSPQSLIVWDTRSRTADQGAYICKDAHPMNINAVAFSPFSEYLLATGSSDRVRPTEISVILRAVHYFLNSLLLLSRL